MVNLITRALLAMIIICPIYRVQTLSDQRQCLVVTGAVCMSLLRACSAMDTFRRSANVRVGC